MYRQAVVFVFAICLESVFAKFKPGWGVIPLIKVYPCKDNMRIQLTYETGLPAGYDNYYYLLVEENVTPNTSATIKFTSDAADIKLGDSTLGTATTIGNNYNFYSFKFTRNDSSFGVKVKGPTGKIPYVSSVVIDDVEKCGTYDEGFLDDLIKEYDGRDEFYIPVSDDFCGRRKIDYTELITTGFNTKPGDWPWHAAVYSVSNGRISYRGGGTLISRNFILTAAHCVTIRGTIFPLPPKNMRVIVGKYYLHENETTTQERDIEDIIIHEKYNNSRFDNDIALLKLKIDLNFTDYIQPACVWHPNSFKAIPERDIRGTVIGWGFNENDQLSNELRQATMPLVSDITCIKSNAEFFSKMLTPKKFCAGYANGTSVCNGDSGGSFLVFVPADPAYPTSATGSWYVRGIVSVGVSRQGEALCDPYQYVLFTDVAKFWDWLKQHNALLE